MTVENSVKTVRGRPFEPGRSGNPGGRPKIPDDVKEAIRAACPKAVAVLVSLLDDKKSLIRLEAAKTLLDRGYGKPAQAQDITLDVSGSLDLGTQIRRVLLETEDDGCGAEGTD